MEEHGRLPSPSENIRKDLEDAFSCDFEFKGSYAAQKSYQSTPIPGLTIQGLGRVDLPLNSADAKRIASVASQAPFGHGDKTVVDKGVRDTWEIDASSITFANPAWNEWLHSDALPWVYRELGLTNTKNIPRCELYKLLLYQEGSHFLAHQDTEKCPGMFATMVVALPSLFTGGVVEVSHAGQRKSLDIAASSQFCTSVLAWYTDVVHEVKKVTSGYRLALSFNLIQPKALPAQSFLDPLGSAYKLFYHILLSWKQNAKDDSDIHDAAPEKLAILLDHQYTDAEFSTKAFKGKDLARLNQLIPAADALGFDIYFADTDYHVEGPGQEDEMIEVDERTFEILALKDRDGQAVFKDRDEFLIDEEEEMIPREALKLLEDQTPDDMDYQGYMGNEAGSVEHWYKRMLLILWPNCRRLRNLLNLDPPGVVEQLEGFAVVANRDIPQDKERFQSFMELGGEPRLSAAIWVRSMLSIALRWGDLEAFDEVFQKGQSDEVLAALGGDLATNAIQVFGLEDIKPKFDGLLQRTTKNASRLRFFSRTTELLRDDQTDIRYWCLSLELRFCSSLMAVEIGDEDLLVKAATRHGGFEFIRDVIIPQLVTVNCGKGFLLKFAIVLHRHDADLPGASRTNIDKCTHLMLSRAAEETPLLQRGNDYNMATMAPLLAIGEITIFLNTCLEIWDRDALSTFLNRLCKIEAMQPTDTRLRKYLRPVALLLDKLCKERTIAMDQEPLTGFFARIGELYLSSDNNNKSPQHATEFLEIAEKCGGIRYIIERAIPKLKTTKPTFEFLNELVRRVRALTWSKDITSAEGDDVLTLRPLVVQDLVSLAATMIQPDRDILSVLRLCIETGNYSQSRPALDEISSRLTSAATSIARFLPLVSQLCVYLAEANVPKSAEPFRTFYKQFVTHYVGLIGPRPSSIPTLPILGCSETQCKELAEFLHRAPRTMDYRGIKRDGMHLEQHLKQKLSTLVMWETIAKGSPQTLRITKLPLLAEYSVWAGRREDARGLVRQIGGEALLRAVLENEYDAVMAAIRGEKEFTSGSMQASSGGSNAVAGSASSSRGKQAQPKPSFAVVGRTTRPRSPAPLDNDPKKKRRSSTFSGPVIDLTTP